MNSSKCSLDPAGTGYFTPDRGRAAFAKGGAEAAENPPFVGTVQQ